MTGRPPRLQVLDSVRGLAAVAVVLHHLLLAFWPYLADPAVPPPPGRAALARWAAASPAVGRPRRRVRRRRLLRPQRVRPGPRPLPPARPGRAHGRRPRRYFRLALPVLASVLLSYALLRSAPTATPPPPPPAARPGSGAGTGSPRPAGRPLRRPAPGPARHVPQRQRHGLQQRPLDHVRRAARVAAGVRRPGPVRPRPQPLDRLRRRRLVLASQDSLLFDFLLGMAMCDAYVNGPRLDLRWSAGPLLAVAAGLACRRPALGDDRLPGVVPRRPSPPPWSSPSRCCSPPLRRWADARPLAWLGRISFGLYLAHMLVIASAGSAPTSPCAPRWSHDAAAAAASAVTLAVEPDRRVGPVPRWPTDRPSASAAGGRDPVRTPAGRPSPLPAVPAAPRRAA